MMMMKRAMFLRCKNVNYEARPSAPVENGVIGIDAMA
jgi:hypothetical protein